MARYTTEEGICVELPEGYAEVFGDIYTRVPDDTPLTPRECCGGTGWIVNGQVVHPGDSRRKNKKENA